MSDPTSEPTLADAYSPFNESERLIHEPARLLLMNVLAACQQADYTYLQRVTRLTAGNLTTHLVKLEQAGFVHVTKGFAGKVPRTMVALTSTGQAALANYWDRLERLRHADAPTA